MDKRFIRALKEAYDLSYVDVMPERNPQMDPNRLSQSEIYSLRTAGYRRDEPVKEAKNQMNPPAATPDADRHNSGLKSGGDPMTSVYQDRLNSSARFDDAIAKHTMKGQEKMNRNLESARSKVGKKGMEALSADRKGKENTSYIDRMAKAIAKESAEYYGLGTGGHASRSVMDEVADVHRARQIEIQERVARNARQAAMEHLENKNAWTMANSYPEGISISGPRPFRDRIGM